MKLPLLEEEVKGVDALRAFTKNLVVPYKAVPKPGDDYVRGLEQEVKVLRQKVAALEQQVASKAP